MQPTSGQIQFNNQEEENTRNPHSYWDFLDRQNEEETKRRKKRHREVIDAIVEDRRKLGKMIASADEFCFCIKTHMPLDLFPDELMVDIHKVTYMDIRILSKDVISIPIKDIGKVEVTNDILFASMEIQNSSQTTIINLSWLWKDDSRQVQAMIQGLIIAYKNDIHLEDLTPNEILEKIEPLGTTVA